jgi:chlorobactene glucosyltransferase
VSYLIQLAWLIFYVWLLGAALTLLSLARQRFLKPAGPAEDVGEAPLVSVLVPARNEEGRVPAECVRSILAQDYGNFEVVAVNDRSTDATGRILRSLASQDPRLRVLEGAETPEGWLGKPHALRQALADARGRWILSTDADIIFHRSALRTAVGYAQEHSADAVTLVPRFEAVSFWERVFIPVWDWGALIFFPVELVNHPRSPLAMGLGGFFLMRREALERVGGFAAVRADVLDDMRLAGVLKKSGARMRAEHAPGLVRTRMYTGLAELWESAAKNWFAILGFSIPMTLLMLAWIIFVAVLPAALAAVSFVVPVAVTGEGAWRQLFVPSFLSWAMSASLLALVNRRVGVPAVYALTTPLGWLLSCAVIVGSAYGVLSGRGLVWKGRKFYERGGVRPPGRRAGVQRGRS